ncbi:MAG: DUF3616 domain-containing protein [Adhaeribacter sp.]
MKNKSVTLSFDNKLSFNPAGKHVRDGLSASIRVGDYLWLCCDERISLERLQLQKNGSFAGHESFDLTEYLHLPGGTESEIDIEGLAYEDHYLWLVGSHSLARKKPRKEDSPEKQIKRLAKLKQDPNRYLLARIPLVADAETGEYRLYKSCPHPDQADKTLWAAQLAGDDKGNELMDALADDPHFQDFLRIPGKDNGFDIEGLAVNGERILLGIRGPVLRGWAAILELQVKEQKEGLLSLKKNDDHKLYTKHFLHMEGMGIRDMRVVNKSDLLLLAGPTMDLDGTIAVYRWPQAMKQKGAAIVHRRDLKRLFDVPHGSGPTTGQDKAEGMAIYDDRQVLIVFDSPADARKPDDHSIVADLYPID